MTLDQFKSQLSALLRDKPRGTTADLTDFAIAYWNGHEVVYAFLQYGESDAIDEEFELGDFEWEDWRTNLSGWIAHPTFSVRPEVAGLIEDSPPNEAE